MIKRTLPLLISVFLALTLGRAATGVRFERLTLEQARVYMLELINRDRAAKELPPVVLDPVATKAGQKHAEEMALERYLSHWNRQGQPPDQRYTEQGGMDHVSENVLLQTTTAGGIATAPLMLEEKPTFTRQEIEEVEAAYFNQTPPHDGHRRNILAPEHTHVGIGLARAGDQSTQTLANTQEFVARYLQCDPLPTAAAVGDTVTVSGQLPDGIKLRCITLAREPLPAERVVEDLRRSGPYTIGKVFVSYWPAPHESPRRVTVTEKGRFQVEAPLTDNGKPGLYYLAVWVTDARGRVFIGSQRTVAVRGTTVEK